MTTWTNSVRDHHHRLCDDASQPVNFDTAAAFTAMYAELALHVANRAMRSMLRSKSLPNVTKVDPSPQ